MTCAQGRLVKNGSSRGHRQVRCRACGRTISVRYGTAYSDLEADSSIFETAFWALAEGNLLQERLGLLRLTQKLVALGWIAMPDNVDS